jgi:uroporphyrinogen-III synthase
MLDSNFEGLRVLTLEGRREESVARLITAHGGVAIAAPAVREVPLPSDPTISQFARGLLDGTLDLVVFLSGLGTTALMTCLERAYPREALVTALQNSTLVARGPESVSALGDFGLEPDLVSPEPHSWREVLAALDAYGWPKPAHEACVAVQELGIPCPELLDGLKERGAQVMTIHPYEWALPEDTSPVEEAIQSLCKGRIDVVLFTSGIQVANLFEIAEAAGTEESLRNSLETVVIGSVGTTTFEYLLSHGLHADVQASRVDIGVLVSEAATQSAAILREKREEPIVDFLHAISRSMSGGGSLPETLQQVVDFCATVVPGDSCFVYILQGDELVLRSSMNSHPHEVDRLRLRLGEGITEWVATHRQPVAISQSAFQDPRFRLFNELPEDRYEAFLSVPIAHRDKLIGVINLQSREPHVYTRREIRLISVAGFFAGKELDRARLEESNSQLSQELLTRKLVERAKGIIQRERGITEHDAYSTLRKQSRQSRRSLKDVAEAIVNEDIERAATKSGR